MVVFSAASSVPAFVSPSSSSSPSPSSLPMSFSTTATSSSSSPLAQSLLANQTYDIEFHGFLSNHAKHAIIALDKLHASEQRIQEYWDEYTTLTPYNLGLHKVDTPFDEVLPCTLEEWISYRGRKIHWQEMVVFLLQHRQLLQQEHQQLERDSSVAMSENDTITMATKRLIQTYAPDLLSGIVGGLTHGIIHLGWAIDAGSSWMVLEGLAYLNFCYVPLGGPSSSSSSQPLISYSHPTDSGPLESLLRVSQTYEDEQLATTWIATTKAKYDETSGFHKELIPAGFQWQMAKIVTHPHPIATEIPSWIRNQPLEKVWESLYQTIVTVFLATRSSSQEEEVEEEHHHGHGNFLILHLLTSLWALEQVCHVLNDNNSDNQEEETIRSALEHYWAVGICLLSASASGMPSVSTIQNAVTAYPFDLIDDSDSFDWTEIVNRGIAEQEEHNIKLVYVCQSLWNRYGHWKGYSEAAQSFTLTPNIGPTKTKN